MKVVCPQCGKDYNIDENRIPQSGITIKCPKCMHTFHVAKEAPPPAEPEPDMMGLSDIPDIPDVPNMDIPSPQSSSLPGAPPPAKASAKPPSKPSSSFPDILPSSDMPDIPDVPGTFDFQPATPKMAEKTTTLPAPSNDLFSDLPSHGEIEMPDLPSVPKDFELVDSDFGSSLQKPPPAPAVPSRQSSMPPAPPSSGLPDAQLPPTGAVAKYFIKRPNGKVYGPFDVQTLKQMLQNRELNGDEEYSRQKDGGWEPLSVDPQFSDVIQKITSETTQPTQAAQAMAAGPRAPKKPKAKREQEPTKLIVPLKILIPSAVALVALIVVGIFLIFGRNEKETPQAQEIIKMLEGGTYNTFKTAYTKSLSLAQQSEDAFYPKALITYIGLFLVRYYEERELLPEIEKNYKMLEDKDETFPYALLARAHYKIQQQDGVLAQGLAKKAIEDDDKLKTNPIVSLLVADALAINNPESAVSAYTTLAQTGGRIGDLAYFRLAKLYEKLEKNAEAKEALMKGLGEQEDELLTVSELVRLADISTVEGRDDVIKRAPKITQREDVKSLPNSIIIGLRMKLAEVYLQQKLYDQAERELARVIELAPSDVSARKKHGEALFNLGKSGPSAREFENALQQNPQDADSLVGLVRAWIKDRNVVDALQKLKDAVTTLDKDARVWYYLGLCNQEIEKYKEAEEAFRKAIELDKNYLDPYLKLAALLSLEKRENEAQEVLESARATGKDSPDVAYGLAEIDLTVGRTNEAIKALTEMLAKYPDYYNGYHLLGKAYLKAGYVEEAMKSLQYAYDKNKYIAGLSLSLGQVYYAKGEYEKALEFFGEAQKETPDNPAVLTQTGKTLFKLNKLDDAIGNLDSALTFDRRNAEAYLYKGFCLREKKDFDSAITTIRNAVTEDPKNPEYLLELGRTNNMAQRFTDAAVELQKAAELAPNSWAVFETLGETYYKLQNYSQAIKSFTKAIENGAQPAPLWMRIGTIYKAQNDHQKAIKAFSAAVKLDKSIPGGHLELAKSFLAIEKTKPAMEELKASLKYDPQNSEAYRLLGYAYKDQGNKKLAHDMFVKYLELNPNADDKDEVEDELRFLK